MNTPPLPFSKEVFLRLRGQQELCNMLSTELAQSRAWPWPMRESCILNPHITLKPTTTLNTDKHPANKRPVVWETVMMTLSCKQANMPQEMSPSMIVLARLTSWPGPSAIFDTSNYFHYRFTVWCPETSQFPRAQTDVFKLLPLSNQQFKSQSNKRSSTLITLRIKNLEPASVWHFCFMNDWNHLSKQLAIAFLKWCNSGERIVVCSSNSDALGWFSGQSHQRWYLATWGWNKQLCLPLLAAAFNRLIDLMSNHAAHC